MDLQIDKLVIAQVPDQFELTISTKIKPAENKALEGLYVTNGRFCTQCEVQGFRRITYFLDRPDVLSRYRVELRADRKKIPGPSLKRQSGGERCSRRWTAVQCVGRSLS